MGCQKKSTTQEGTRLEVPRVFLDETISCLREFVQRMKAELILNLDEVGMSDWEDRKDKKVVVAQALDGQTIHHRVSRNVRHISIISCVGTGGESLTPYVVTSQDSKRVRERLKSRRVRLGVDFVLRYRSKPYVNGEFCLEYINIIFIPYLTLP
jgi:hypothetical protein